MRVLCVQGLQAGAGGSTISANLARMLLELNQKVLVFDLNPNNLLRLHFNMDWQDPSGWAFNLIQEKPWCVGFECEHGISFLPFGQLTYQTHQRLMVDYLDDNKLHHQLNSLDLPPESWLILNITSEINPLNKQALALSHFILRVFEPSVASLSLLIDSMQSSYILDNVALSDKTFYLINKLIFHSELDHEMTLIFKSLLLNRLLPINIHFDENVKEAFANKTTINTYAPASTVTREFRTLTIWLMSYFNRLMQS